MELLFHSGDMGYDKDGLLQKEPGESLEELLIRYEECCKIYSDFKKRELEAAKGYVHTRWKNGVEPVFFEDTKRNYGHRTWVNAEWADITLALASDLSSPGEITTKKAAGPKYVGFELPADFGKTGTYPVPLCNLAEKLAGKIMVHPYFKKDGLKLNIAGNSQITLTKAGITTNQVLRLLSAVVCELRGNGVRIAEIRSGGQTGVDEAGIKAAQEEGIKCSVLAPKGFRMHYEEGVELEDREQFTDRFREKYIDYDAWMKNDEDGCLNFGLADFNGFNGLDLLEYDIDLKIMHINARESSK